MNKCDLGNSLRNSHKQAYRSKAISGIHTNGVAEFGQHVYNSIQVTQNPATQSSVTETSDLTEFLNRAELLGASFDAEKDSLKLVTSGAGVISKAERLRKQKLHADLSSSLKIPRRPNWNKQMSSLELDIAEKEAFLQWRECMAQLESAEDLVMTPFEKNLEFWRQLWRVVERSNVLLQIVDARNPLFFFSEDLVTYVKEVDSEKKTAVLINKSDLLSVDQIDCWNAYFKKIGTSAFFWSAVVDSQDVGAFSGRLLSSDELIDNLKLLFPGESTVTIGLVGYPNVGKSSTINAILKAKKVAVSTTPGRTKHFQTVHLSDDLVLCDCPGLVMPQFVYTKDDLVVNSVLPIDNMRDCLGPVQLLCHRIPRHIFETKYSLTLPAPNPECATSKENLRASDLLAAFARLHGFMTSKGCPHLDRAARILLKDYVQGDKLRYCHPPPDFDGTAESFNPQLYENCETVLDNPNLSTRAKNDVISDFDKTFFTQRMPGFGVRGIQNSKAGVENVKRSKRHNNKNKKEKLRRMHRDLDIQ